MSKQEFLKIQTCVLKVNIHCNGCKRQVKKILMKIEGVYTVVVDSEQGKVTVSGNVDPPTLIKKLAKSGKHGVLWGAPKPNQQMDNLFKNMQIDSGKGGVGNNKNQGQKGQIQQGKGGQPQLHQGGAGGLTTQQVQQLQQLKGFQDMKLPPQFKDMKLPPFGGGGGGKDAPKSVNFKMSESDESDYYDDDDDDEFGDDDEDYDDDDDEFDDDDDELDDIPMKKPTAVGSGGDSQKAKMMMNQQFMKDGQMPLQMMKGVPQIANAGGMKRGGNGNIPVQMNGGMKKAGGGEINNGGNQNHGSGGKGNGGQNKNVGGGVNGNGLPNMMGMSSGGAGLGSMGHMGAVQGLPASSMMTSSRAPNGYLQGLGAEPMSGNPYYQQQLGMKQQRANGNDNFQPMMYARPPPAVNYMQPPSPYSPYPYPQPPPGDPITHYFNDDNTSSSCNVM